MNVFRSLMSIRFACVALLALLSGACGGSASSPSSASTPAYSQTDLVVGTGATATSGRTVTVSYTGWLYDASKSDFKGTQFDSSANFTFVLGAGRVIAGWDQGVVGMRVGGQRRLIIPPSLAYGSQSPSNAIPPNSTLVFDITLLNVN